MIAVIVAAVRAPAVHGIDEHIPLSMFPLGDRPILHHIVDYLVAQGVRRFEFLLGHLPEKVESYFVDGARWGCTFNFHLMPLDPGPLRMAEIVASDLDDEIILGHGDRLPEFQLVSPSAPTLFVTESDQWTGWAILPRRSRPFAELDRYASGNFFNTGADFDKVIIEHEVDFGTAEGLLKSQRDILSGVFSGSAIGTRQTKPGIWICRNVSLHSAAQVQPPVFIGPNCKIQSKAQIGPWAVIGEGCIIDEQTSIANTLVLPGTYVGQHLELDHVIADRSRLVNARIGTSLLISESFLLSALNMQTKPRVLHRFISTIVALALFVLLGPIALLTLFFLWIGRRGSLMSEQAVRIPAADDPHGWEVCRFLRFRLEDRPEAGWWPEFAAEVWPGLLSVITGKLYLVGLKPRAPREVERLPDDWKDIYLRSKAGLLTEASVMFGRFPSEDELYTAEAYYSATESLHHDLKLMWLYLRRLLSYRQQIRMELTDDSTLNSTMEKAAEH
jgi:NDP-sugar pyrophosphorylase family protein